MTDMPDHDGSASGKGPYLVVKPGDFINPPYVRCPKCGELAFGIAVIARHQYSRRCKNCLYPSPRDSYSPTRLPALDKNVIYLDQFVISKMMYALNSRAEQHGRDPNEQFFRKVFARLEVLGKKQLLVCPCSDCHDAESLVSESFELHKQMYELLGFGVRWHDTDSVRRYQIIGAFRDWCSGALPNTTLTTDRDNVLLGDRTGWTDHFYVPSHLRWNPKLVEEIRQTRDNLAEELRPIFEMWQADKDMCFGDWVREEIGGAAKGYAKAFLQQVEEVAAAEKEVMTTQQFSLNTFAAFLPGHGAQVMLDFRHALMERGLGEGEWFARAREFLTSEYFTGIPFVKISAMIWATVAHRAAHCGQKKLPTKGFHNDVRFLSTYLPYCEAMFVDREAHGILDDPLMKECVGAYGTRIFSLRNRDEFLAYLDKIETSTSPEHLDRLKDVYGEDYLKPYLGLYDDFGPVLGPDSDPPSPDEH